MKASIEESDCIESNSKRWNNEFKTDVNRRLQAIDHQILCEKDGKMFWCGEWHSFRAEFTSKELEEAGFGWVFDCPGIQIEEVE